MTTGQVKKAINKKFKSITNFAEVSGIPRVELQIILNKKKPVQDELSTIMDKVNKLPAREPENRLTPLTVTAIPRGIRSCRCKQSLPVRICSGLPSRMFLQ
jgi:hypothetical protein